MSKLEEADLIGCGAENSALGPTGADGKNF
jgi:hypothetical protein